jgi:hypothetical protein
MIEGGAGRGAGYEFPESLYVEALPGVEPHCDPSYRWVRPGRGGSATPFTPPRHRNGPMNAARHTKVSDRAIGIISNHGDSYFPERHVQRLLDRGARRLVYMGSLSGLGSQTPGVMELLDRRGMQHVYGVSEPLESPQGPIALPPGHDVLQIDDIALRFFLPADPTAASSEPRCAQWVDEDQLHGLLLECLQRSGARILVVGSGIGLLHMACDLDGDRILDVRQEPGGRWPQGHDVLELVPGVRHIVVTPSSRTHCCSILDPVQGLLVGYSS